MLSKHATEAEEEMLTVLDYDRIRQAYYNEQKSIRQIEREYGHSYWTIRKALEQSEPEPYRLSEPKVAPVLGPYHGRIEQLLADNATLPRKQRYTSKKIYQTIRNEGLPRSRVDGALLREPTTQSAEASGRLPAVDLRPRRRCPGRLGRSRPSSWTARWSWLSCS